MHTTLVDYEERPPQTMRPESAGSQTPGVAMWHERPLTYTERYQASILAAHYPTRQAAQHPRTTPLPSTSTAPVREHAGSMNQDIAGLAVRQRHAQSSSRTPFEPSPRPVASAPQVESYTPVGRSPPQPSLQQRQRQADTTMHRHQVYNLYCAHCETFLTDRGMRAVLLLRPSISLYSTDAQSLYCGPCFLSESKPTAPDDRRTCACLTQAVHCFCCGTAIGYHIITPCSNCDAVVQATQTGTDHSPPSQGPNGHRFVFHVGDIKAHQRRYAAGEPGVVPALVQSPHRTEKRARHHFSPQQPFNNSTHASSLGPGASVAVTGTTHPNSGTADKETTMPPNLVEGSQVSYKREYASLFPVAPTSSQQARRVNGLQDGDVLYWHQLARCGERPPIRDPATRPPRLPICGR